MRVRVRRFLAVLADRQPLFLCHDDRCPVTQPIGFNVPGQGHRRLCLPCQVRPFPSCESIRSVPGSSLLVLRPLLTPVPAGQSAETLRFSSTQVFNNVVVHYDKPPVTGGDYGCISLADNMAVTPAPPPIILNQARMLGNGTLQLAFTNSPGLTFTAVRPTNLALPLTNWYVLGTFTEISAGSYQFTDLQATNRTHCYYRVRSP